MKPIIDDAGQIAKLLARAKQQAEIALYCEHTLQDATSRRVLHKLVTQIETLHARAVKLRDTLIKQEANS